MVRSGRRRRLVVVVVAPVVQQVSFERRVEHVNVQILERGRPALVQHLQHVGQLVALARMLARVVRMVPGVGVRVRMVVVGVVHLVRMTAGHGRVVRMVGMHAAVRVAPVVLLTVACRRGQVVLHVFGRDVLHVHGRGGSGGTVTAAAAAATVGVRLHRFGRGGRVVRLPTAPDAGSWLRRGGRVRRRLARSGRAELRVRGPRRRPVRTELTVLVTFGNGLRLS